MKDYVQGALRKEVHIDSLKQLLWEGLADDFC